MLVIKNIIMGSIGEGSYCHHLRAISQKMFQIYDKHFTEHVTAFWLTKSANTIISFISGRTALIVLIHSVKTIQFCEPIITLSSAKSALLNAITLCSVYYNIK